MKKSSPLPSSINEERRPASIGTGHRQAVGRKGEELAAAFLMANGCSVLDRNWRCRAGEIDLIVQKEGVIHFVEVKTRLNQIFGHPEESVTRKKLEHMARAAETWLQGKQRNTPFQIDVIAILAVPGAPPQIEWFQAVL